MGALPCVLEVVLIDDFYYCVCFYRVSSQKIKGAPMNGKGVQIHVIGAGGIGSNLIALLLPTLKNGIVSEQLDGITFHLHDADIIEERNLAHQRFSDANIGMPKVDALVEEFDLGTPADIAVPSHFAEELLKVAGRVVVGSIVLLL